MRAFLSLCLCFALAGCGDLFGPKPAALSVSVAETFLQPDVVEIVFGDGYTIFRTHTVIDVEVTNHSTATIVLPTCGLGNTTPSLLLERADGSPSRLQQLEVCAGGGQRAVAAGETLQVSFDRRVDFFCGPYAGCPMAEPGTWGAHRLRLRTEQSSVRSNSFAVRSPIIFDF